jgi:hypothetical protein
MNHGIIDPTCKVLIAMKKEIPLEILGTDHIKNAWPLNDIVSMLSLLDRQTMSNFNDDAQLTLGYMIQGFRNIHESLLTAVAMQDPFAEQPVQVFPLNPIVPQQFQRSQQQYQAPQQQHQAPQQQYQASGQVPQAQTPAPANAGMGSSSFANLNTATNIPTIRITEPPMFGNADSTSAPAAAVPTTSTSAASERDTRIGLKSCILEEYANFKGNVVRMVVQGKAKNSPREEITETFEELLKSVSDATGVLAANDEIEMKAQIKVLQHRIASLSQVEKNHGKTREVDVLAAGALALWA